MSEDPTHYERARDFVLPRVRAVESAAWTLGMFGAVRAHQKLADEGREQAIFDRYTRRWAQGLLNISGTEVVMASPPGRPASGPRMVVANHRAAMDIPIMLAHFGGSIVSRDDLADWPVLGPGAKSAGTIFVNNEDRASTVRALRTIRDTLKAGRQVILFPEGTTFDGDEVRPFFRGALSVARTAKVPILPVGLAYPPGTEYVEDEFMAHAGKYAANPAVEVGMAVGEEEYAPSGGAALAEHFQARVQELVHRARKAVG